MTDTLTERIGQLERADMERRQQVQELATVLTGLIGIINRGPDASPTLAQYSDLLQNIMPVSASLATPCTCLDKAPDAPHYACCPISLLATGDGL